MNIQMTKGSKMRAALMLIALPFLPVLLVPMTKVAIDTGPANVGNASWTMAGAVPMRMSQSPVNVSDAARNIEKSELSVPEKVLKARETISEDRDGNIVQETFNPRGSRVTKSLATREGVLLNRWHFDPESKKVLRYEVNTYQEGRLAERRVSQWEYTGQEGFIKTSRIFDADSKLKSHSLEEVNAKGIKYQERWYDSNERLLSEKGWNPESGDFIGGFVVSYLAGGWSRRQYQDTRGHTFREVLFTPKGEVFKVAGIVFGKQR